MGAVFGARAAEGAENATDRGLRSRERLRVQRRRVSERRAGARPASGSVAHLSRRTGRTAALERSRRERCLRGPSAGAAAEPSDLRSLRAGGVELYLQLL